MLAVLLTVMMVFTMMPAAAMAAEAESTDTTKKAAATMALNIAQKYQQEGFLGTGQEAWFAADLAAYEKTCAEKDAFSLSPAQKQEYINWVITKVADATKPGDLSKYIISMVALGFDPTDITTADGTKINAVTKLTDQFETNYSAISNEYTLPYVIIALGQDDSYATEEQMNKMLASAVETKERWMSTNWGPDAMTPMILALSSYQSQESIAGVLQEAKEKLDAVWTDDSENFSNGINACSLGLAAAAYSSLGIDPDTVTSPEGTESIAEKLLQFANTSGNGFLSFGSDSIWSTEQGFRGLIAILGYQTGGYHIYDFSDHGTLVPAKIKNENEQLADNIAQKYVQNGVIGTNSEAWLIADLADYKKINPETVNVLTEEKIQEYLKWVIPKISEAQTPGDLSKYILSLVALGFDPTNITTSDGTKINAVTRLTDQFETNYSGISNIYTLPYVIIALSQDAGYASEEQMNRMLDSAVQSKADWMDTKWGPDAITPMMLALSKHTEYEGVSAVLQEAKTVLDTAVWTENANNANSLGLAAAAYSAVGIDPKTVADEESDQTLMGQLLTFKNDSSDGFLFYGTDNHYATEQAFRGLNAANGYQDEAFRIYDFSDHGTLLPASAEEKSDPVVPPAASDDITVWFTLVGHDKHGDNGNVHTYREGTVNTIWIARTAISVAEGSKAKDVIEKALRANGISFTNATGGYISEVNGLEHLDNGKNSGWLYHYNGEEVAFSIDAQPVKNGDEIVLFYTDDFTKEKGAISWNPDMGSTTDPIDPDTDTESEAEKTEKIAAGVQATELKARSEKVSNGIKITWTKSKGYKVDYYEVFRSTKRYSGYGKTAFYTTKNAENPAKTWYVNTKDLKTGTRYYYKVRGVRMLDGEKVYTQWSTKAWRIA